MTENVDPAIIETKVCAKRQPEEHVGRYITEEATFYILHSQDCVDFHGDLRNCDFSLALDHSDQERANILPPDVPFTLYLSHGRIMGNVAVEEA